MKKALKTRQMLLFSVLSLMLSVSMLLGTTYAWFTDSVSSGSNVIQSGSLDVEVEFAKVENGELSDWQSIAGRSDVFDPNALWEPGRAEVVYLKVSNLGTLALKYKLTIHILSEEFGVNAEDELISLSDTLVFKVIEMDDSLDVFSTRQEAVKAAGTELGLKDYSSKAQKLEAGEVDYLACVVYMPESVGNDFNYRGATAPSIELGINLLATQVSHENDSFGSDYDKNLGFGKSYGLLIEQDTDLLIENYNFDLLSEKHVDALIHVTDGAVVNIYGNTNRMVYSGGIAGAPVITADSRSVINIRGGSYGAKESPIFSISDGAKINIYRGIFSADAFSGDADHVDNLVSFDKDAGCDIQIYGGTFVNFDPRASHLGNLVADDHIALTTVRDNGEIWYTIVHKDYAGYTPVFSFEEATAVFESGKTNVLFACDVNAKENVENLMYATGTETLKISGHGATFVANGTGTKPNESYDYGYIGFIPVPGYNAEISDMKFVGEGFVEIAHHKLGGGTYVAENIVIEDLIATLFIPNDDNLISPAFCHYGTLTLKDCVMTGTTTKKVGYKPYDAAFVNGTKTFIEGGTYGAVYTSDQAHVTINGAEVDVIDYNAIKYKGKDLGTLTIGQGTKIGTLNVLPGGYEPGTITIEDGAEIGAIVYKGTTYTVEEWLAR